MMPFTKPKTLPTALGFSLIELVVVIILLGILAVSVGTRFVGTDGFAELSYQSRLISSLRTMQARAMHDTRPATPANPSGYCFQINFSTTLPAFGAPSLRYGDADGSPTCSSAIDFANAQYLGTGSGEMEDKNVAIVTLDDNGNTFEYLRFDSLGRPLTNVGQCSSGCRVELSGEQTVAVCIAAQGYIYAC